MMTIVDDLVSVDTLIEDHLCEPPVNEYVQSCDIVAFNKICKFPATILTFMNVAVVDDLAYSTCFIIVAYIYSYIRFVTQIEL